MGWACVRMTGGSGAHRAAGSTLGGSQLAEMVPCISPPLPPAAEASGLRIMTTTIARTRRTQRQRGPTDEQWPPMARTRSSSWGSSEAQFLEGQPRSEIVRGLGTQGLTRFRGLPTGSVQLMTLLTSIDGGLAVTLNDLKRSRVTSVVAESLAACSYTSVASRPPRRGCHWTRRC